MIFQRGQKCVYSTIHTFFAGAEISPYSALYLTITGPVPLGGVAVALAAGDKHSVALMSGGTVRTFGSGEFGQLGYGSTDNVGDTDDDWASTTDPSAAG